MRRSGLLGIGAALLIGTSVACSSQPPGPRLSHDDVAVVGRIHITKGQYTSLLARATSVTTHAHTPLPESEDSLKSAVVSRLVSDAEQRNAALDKHTTVDALRSSVQARAKVGPAVRATFIGFLSDGPRSARETRLILLYDRPVAQTLFAQLSVGSNAAWCKSALKSVERAPAYRCGTELITNGEVVQPLDRLVFSMPQDTPTLARTSNGYWAILEAVSPIYRGGTAAQVHELLLTQSKTVRLGRWEALLTHGYCTGKNVSYRHGYQPDPDPTACPS